MHDWTGVVVKTQNDEGVVFTDAVDEYGYISYPITCESIRNYRHVFFAMQPTYVCECGNEYAVWQDVLDHLELFGDPSDEALPWPG